MDSSYSYDFFLSYRHSEPEKSWVRKILVPSIEQHGVRCMIDYRDFRLGAPLVTEMVRAVQESRYTLAIISDAYLQSTFTDFEKTISKHLGLEMNRIQLIGIIRDPNLDLDKIPLEIRSSLMLDMTDDDDFDIMIQRLLRVDGLNMS